MVLKMKFVKLSCLGAFAALSLGACAIDPGPYHWEKAGLPTNYAMADLSSCKVVANDEAARLYDGQIEMTRNSRYAGTIPSPTAEERLRRAKENKRSDILEDCMEHSGYVLVPGYDEIRG